MTEQQLPSPLTRIADEAYRAFNAGYYYLAIAVILTLPDICAALQSPGGDSSSKKYQNWVADWFLQSYPMLKPEDIWALRNGVLHNAKFGHEKLQYSKIMFSLPNSDRARADRNKVHDALNLDAFEFCGNMVRAVERWQKTYEETLEYKTNVQHLFQYRTFLIMGTIPIPVIC